MNRKQNNKNNLLIQVQAKKREKLNRKGDTSRTQIVR